MLQPTSRDARRTSVRPTPVRQDQRASLKRRRRLRLAPLLLGLAFIALITVFATASSDASPPASTSPSTSLSGPAGSEVVASVDAAALARSAGANEMGRVMVLMYHLIGHNDSQYNRTPEQFRQDIAHLKAAGYYPVNLRDLVSGDIDVPAGKSPVVITFDDSSGGQYRISADGQLDPDCAVAIMQEAARQGGWAGRASFYPLLDVDAPDHVLFGQPKLAQKKLQQLVSWGYEIGSHTVSHLNLQKASASEIKKQLYVSAHTLEEMIGGGYKVTSLAAPFGAYPSQATILKTGKYEGRPYAYDAALKATGGASFSPFSDGFRAYHIPRIEVSGTSLSDALSLFERTPQLRYISDGDPATIAVPASLDDSLGSVRTELRQEVVRY
jgi:peptidoglycan/xylan/chitin deacetylase (PgdA/CDA1 family)